MLLKRAMNRLIVALSLCCASATVCAVATPELDAAQLGEKVQRFLEAGAANDFPKADVRVNVNALDSRLHFPACDDLALMQHGARGLGRTSVTARCDAPQPWAASMTATIEVWRPVVVLVHALPADTVIQAADIALQPRNLADLHDQYIGEADRAIGWTTRRPVVAGAVLSARQLVAPIAINKGDEVRIRSGTGAVMVSMNGTALDKGMPGEQIAVRNVQSDRVIKAWVVGPGLVSTGPREP